MVSELATEVNIGVQSELTTIDQTDVAVVSLTGAGANSDDKTALVAGDKIAFATETVTVDGKPVEAIKISSTDTTYTLEQDETKVKLTGGGKTQSVEFKAGNKLDVTADANGGILYSHETIGSAATYGSTDVTGTTNAQVINIPVITTDGYGHIASAQTAPLTINNTTITGATIGVDETDASKLTVSVTDNNGQRIPATSEGVLYHTITVTDLDADGEEVETTNTIKNQGNLGSFYSKAVIDKKLQGIDAFTYKGTFTGNLPVAGKQYHVGDVYVSKEDQNVELNNISVTLHAGDLVYVTGTETNGIITENLKFEVVHSENNTDTTYDLIAENDKITLTDGAAKDDINVTDDDIVILKATGGALQASHKTYSTAAMADGITQPTGALIDGGTFSAASVDADKYGHVTSIEKIDYTLPSYALAQANEKLQLKSGGRVLGSVTPAGDDKISATFSGADENVTLTINHLGSQATKGTSTPAALTFGGTFVAVSGLVDEKGHVKEYTETTYTLPSLPADPVYTFNDFVITDNQTLENHGTGLSLASYILKDGERTGTLDFGLYSDTLAVTKVDANNVAVELVWGTF
ncbi:MAG: hypothetical protein E7167_01785 [Firmicutes bacterium]|nr:hypothetical protein [Bacillota bacterium]